MAPISPPLASSTTTQQQQLASAHMLELVFHSLDSLSSKPEEEYLSLIADAARSTRYLRLHVHLAFDFPTHSRPAIPAPSSSQPSQQGNASGGEAVAGASSSSSSSSSGAPMSSSRPTPVLEAEDERSSSSSSSAFDILEPFLSSLYSAATRVFIEERRPLDVVDVVLQPMRGLNICWTQGGEPSSSSSSSRRVHIGGGEDGSEEGKGKGEWEGQYDVVALGGTFDHLHAGHKILLSLAAYLTRQRLIVGVTDDVLLKNKKFSNRLESLDERIRHVGNFLDLIRPTISHDVVPIQDVYGPTAWDEEVRALVVSDETRKGGEAVNEERRKKGLTQLDTFVIKLIGHEGHSEGTTVEAKMGSTAIRQWIDETS